MRCVSQFTCRTVVGLAAGAFLLLSASPARATFTQFTIPADADVVAESSAAPPAGIDSGGRAFLSATQAAARAAVGQVGNGLPDNGQFIDVSTGGVVQLLPYTGNNVVRRSGAAGNGFTIDVPDGKYSALTLLATAGDAASTLTIGLNYSDGTVNIPGAVVPDWFTDPPPSGVGYLIDGLDRTLAGGAGFEDANDPAIFALTAGSPLLDSTRTLTSISLTRTSTTDTLNVFGAFGNAVPEPASLGLLMTVSAAAVRRRRRLA
jgi:hypothetical protein